MSDSIHDDFSAVYNEAVRDFRKLRERYTRTSFHSREFVLVSRITEHLEEPKSHGFSSDLNRLLVSAHQTFRGGAPDVSLTELKTCRTIFYILIDLGIPKWLPIFRDQGKKDSHLPISLATLKDIFEHNVSGIDPAVEVDNLSQRFSSCQYCWCPMLFKLNMGESHYDRVIPLYEKKVIDVPRDISAPEHSHSKLWKVIVPADLISDDMQVKMKSTKFSRPVDNEHIRLGTVEHHTEECYKFVIKEFQTLSRSPSEKEKLFKREMGNTKQLKDSDGILQYFGWYHNLEPDGCQNFNLVLELGECDFYTYIRNYYPPVSTQEIMRFWEHMVDLSIGLKEIHTLKLDNVDYDMCHGDIKPENIIWVEGRFKIADPAEGYVVPSSPWKYPRAARVGGTVTYASPEKSQELESSTTDLGSMMRLPLNSDVWSLGCVFSVAATYVVLGELGVDHYQTLRQAQNMKIRGKITDTFHDGSNILPSVSQWHDYLRQAVRGTDKITKAVLDFVDDHMLVSDHANRKDACGVVKLLTEILRAPPEAIDRFLEPPQEILEFLQGLEQKVGALSEQDIARSPSSTYDALGLQLADRSDVSSIRQPTSQRLQQQQSHTATCRTFPLEQENGENASLRLNPITSNGGWSSQLNSPPEYETVLQDVTDMWMVEADLEKHQKPGLFGVKKKLSVKQKKQTDELDHFFDNRDLVFLVDNSWSMNPHWTHATYLIRVLAWRALGYDEDGMELYFTETSDYVEQKKSQKVDDFSNAMAKAKPNYQNSTSPNGIIRTLTNILNNSSQLPQDRPKTIIILTDGVWERLPKDEAVDKLIRYYLDGLPEDIKKLDKRPITFQFISFGYNKEALERLRRLDDDIQLEDFPDFVDTEHATGDVYKMFLGSLSEEIDQAEYYCPRCAANQPRSQLASSPVRHRSQSNTQEWT